MPDGSAALVRCTRCGESKPPSEFHRNRRMKTGLHYSCKKCNSLAKAEAYRRPEVREKKLAAKARRLDELAPPGTKRAMRRALQQIVAQVYDRDCEPTAETAEICGRIARAALEGEAE